MRLSFEVKVKPVASLFLFVMFGLTISGAPAANRPSSKCGSLSTKTVVSPDKAWNAVVQEKYCAGEFAFTSWATYTVRIVSRVNPAQSEDIYYTHDDGDSQQEPIVSWMGNHKLQISALRDPLSNLRRSAFRNIAISYKFRTYR